MLSNQGELTWNEALTSSFELRERQATSIKKTYLLLLISVASAIGGGIIGAESPVLIKFFSQWYGWVAAMIILNVVPAMAMAVRRNPVLGTLALGVDGLVAGLVLAPILWFASTYAEGMVTGALVITGCVFLAVTIVVMATKSRFSAPRGLMFGIMAGVIGSIILGFFVHLTWLSVLISLGIGVLGVIALIHATSQVLNNPEFDEPVGGALMLFGGLFNVFVAVLHLLLAFGGDD